MEAGKVTISKRDEVHLLIRGDPSVLMELSEHFTFMVDGYKFTPAYKQGRWDGSIKLYSLSKKTIYGGLLSNVLEFLESRGYTGEFVDIGQGHPVVAENIDIEDIMSFMFRLNLGSKGSPLPFRDYQANGVRTALSEKKVLLKSATSSGKSLMIYSIFRYLLEENPKIKILLVVPTIGLTSQMLGDFKDYSCLNGFDTDSVVHLISAGKDKNSKKNIYISTYQSIAKLDPEYFEKFDVVACDEAHGATSASITGIFEKCTRAKYRLGFTGTIENTKTNILTLQGLTGHIRNIASTRDLMDAGQVSQLRIKCIILNHSLETKKAFKDSDYEKEIKFLTSNEKRNKFICNLALKTKGTTLVLFRYVDIQGKPLYEMIKSKCTDRDVFFVSGEVSGEKREEIRLSAGKDAAIIVASIPTFKAGVNIPTIDSIIYASPFKGMVTNLQSIGRGLRLSPGKEFCTLFDISDDLSYRKSINYTLTHLTERIKHYSSEGFDFTLTTLDFTT